MNLVLLLGAGFSRNWGGWLASETFEYLLGCSEIDHHIRARLLSHRNTDGLEGALAELQEEGGTRLRRFEEALTRMFGDMNTALTKVEFEFQEDVEMLIRNFLVRFDVIFTLNQDLLMERYYLDHNVALSSYRRWSGWQIPGMKPMPTPDPADNTGKWIPDPSFQFIRDSFQPYIKLHGSSNWTDAGGTQLLVMGGNEPSAIDHFPILKWYHEQFRQILAKSDTRLMVIGYSFGDKHVNNAIFGAADYGDLQIFIIDPRGLDAIGDRWQSSTPGEPMLPRLWQNLRGASRRSLREIFGNDRVEHAKVMRFLG
jgi:SIR2-like domain